MGENSTLTQFISTRPGTEYFLSFFLARHPKPCLNTTVRIQLSTHTNSSMFMVDELFHVDSQNVSNTDMEWKQIGFNFFPQTELTNLAFVNPMKAGTCGPVIDNVSVMKIKKKQDSLSRVAAVAVAISVAVAIVGAAGVIFFVRRANSRTIMAVDSTGRQNHRPNDDNPVHIRTYAMWEVLKATDNFTNKVGEGGFGVVYRANLEDNSIGAVKRATKRGIGNQQIFKEELSVLLRLNHPNLVNLIGLCFKKGEQILVFEFVPNGSLYGRLHKPSWHSSCPLSWAFRINIAFQITVALQYLHEQAEPPVLHHDVKFANVLFLDDNHAKLTDFGLSKLGHRDNQAAPAPLKGSYGYTDP
ncbi:hypothetical protein KI387_040804 [Taxus chinensis]|uniref:Protein kinase domain-containing protein n=1 Tax=Taxus chinensis TaxID=29808 RepID=A0AA38CBH3_TAXCH|nr:hypothetical protein KI387_040804 [Taxus chinensis]